jgi:chorismate-pyruvate lyase
MTSGASLVSSDPTAISQPLEDFYRLAGLPVPAIEEVDAGAVPEPYRTLLVHQTDMTSTLERFHRSPIVIDVLSRKREANYYYREVLLVLENLPRPVEFGAIRIDLSLFPEAARTAVLAEHAPLGSILNSHDIKYLSRPKAYLKIRSDDLINRHLRLSAEQWLYGRRNTLLTPDDGKALAEIVEILPP